MDLKKAVKKLLFPPFWLLILLTVGSAVGLLAVFGRGLENTPLAYAVYVLAFYTLSAVCVFLAMVLPARYRRMQQKIYASPLGNRYMTDAAFRTHISLYLSLAVNLLYVGIHAASGIFYRSMWFAILAGYYAILAVMRFLLAIFVHKNGIGKDRILEFRRTRLCGCILMTLNLTLSGAVLMILYRNKGYEYHGVLIYVMAAYTFYITVKALVNLVGYRKYNSPVMTAAKIITFSAALVSMLSLETAMLSQFGGEMSAENKWIMVAATGAGVSIAVVTMSIYMIVQATKEIGKNGKQRTRNF